jgi:hypothetical protein
MERWRDGIGFRRKSGSERFGWCESTQMSTNRMAVRIAEVDRQAGVDPELSMLSHLRALVPGQRPT